jgi:uncharacterized protein (TIGR02145 family)
LNEATTYSVTVTNGNCPVQVTSFEAVVTMSTATMCCGTIFTEPETTVDFTAFSPCSATPVGTTWYLTDNRLGGNSYTYKVRKMEDGKIWMIEDMRFGDCSETSWYDDNSEAGMTHTPTILDGYVGHCRKAPTAAYYYYSRPAVMQNPKLYYGSSVTYGVDAVKTGCSGVNPDPVKCKGICPDGWHVPTGYYSPSEYLTLYNALKTHTGCIDFDCFMGKYGAVWGGYGNPPYDGGVLDIRVQWVVSDDAYNNRPSVYWECWLGTFPKPQSASWYEQVALALRCVKNP